MHSQFMGKWIGRAKNHPTRYLTTWPQFMIRSTTEWVHTLSRGAAPLAIRVSPNWLIIITIITVTRAYKGYQHHPGRLAPTSYWDLVRLQALPSTPSTVSQITYRDLIPTHQVSLFHTGRNEVRPIQPWSPVLLVNKSCKNHRSKGGARGPMHFPVWRHHGQTSKATFWISNSRYSSNDSSHHSWLVCLQGAWSVHLNKSVRFSAYTFGCSSTVPRGKWHISPCHNIVVTHSFLLGGGCGTKIIKLYRNF